MEFTQKWTQTKKELYNWNLLLSQRKGARDQLIRTKESEEKKLNEFKELKRLNNLAQLFLLSEITERRQEAIDSIEKMSTVALQMIYGDGYGLKFDTFEEKRKEGSTNFKMDINILSPYGDSDDKVLTTGLDDERGGGVYEIVAFALRMAALNWLKYDGPIILDEAYKSMSNDDKIRSVATFIKELTEHTQRQIIFATHKATVFGKVADQIILVTNPTKWLSKCNVISKEEITDDFE